MGRRARTAETVEIRSSMRRSDAAAKVAAYTTVRLVGSKVAEGVESWEVRVLSGAASGLTGWMPRSSLTQEWPAGPADKPAPMLGDRSAEIEALMQLLTSSTFRTRIRAIGSLRASGITDERLFDTIGELLVSAMGYGGPRNVGGKEAVWLTVALATSGNAKYRPLLEFVAEADAGRMSGHADNALDSLEQNARWNQIINDPRNARPDRPAEVARAMNMMQSGDRVLIAAAAQALSPDWHDVFDAIDAALLESYAKPLDGDAEDAVALLAKALGDSGNPKHRATLATVARDAPSRKIRSAAEDAGTRAQTAAKRAEQVTVAPTNPWEARFEVGRRARTTGQVAMRNAAGGKAYFQTLASGESVGLKRKQDVGGAEWWEVLQAGGGTLKTGWVPRTSLTQEWPAGPADKPAVMLGDRSAEIEKLVANLKVSDFKVNVAAARSLHLSGITDERVFDSIAKVLAAGLAQTSDAPESFHTLWAGIAAGIPGPEAQGRIRPKTFGQEVAWLIKGLSFSGNARYRPLLEAAAEFPSRDVSRSAEAALANLEDHARWNQIINAPRNARPGRPDEVARTLNMLYSGDRELVREAVNRATLHAAQWPELPDAVEAELLKLHTLELDSNTEDIAALMAKALRESGNSKYQATLETVARDARSAKLRRYAGR